MTYSIPSDIARADTNGDGFIDRLYVGDTGGQVWRFDITDSNSTNWSGKRVFNPNTSGNNQRKIFYPPDITLEKGNYEMIFFGTGDREHPKDTSMVDRLYAIKDKNPSQPLTESDLYDATQDLIQTGTTAQQTAALSQLDASSGWLIKLDQNSGEKCLANSVIFYGAVYYTTFQPLFGQPGDVCFLNAGTARLYGVNYKTAAAVFDLDGVITDTLGRSDRSAQIGTSIPSGVIITFIRGTTVAYGGMGGGVYRPPLPTTKTLFPTSWRIVF
jgi:type IV pilus assembly protein PilY1